MAAEPMAICAQVVLRLVSASRTSFLPVEVYQLSGLRVSLQFEHSLLCGRSKTFGKKRAVSRRSHGICGTARGVGGEESRAHCA